MRQSHVLVKFYKYSLVGVTCTIIYFSSMYMLIEQLHQKPVSSSVISFLIMTLFSFLLNVKYTFGGTITQDKLIRFTMVSALGFTMNYLLMFLIIEQMHYHYLVGEVVTTMIIPGVNFMLNYLWTFKESSQK